jgi:hypothetical protein
VSSADPKRPAPGRWRRATTAGVIGFIVIGLIAAGCALVDRSRSEQVGMDARAVEVMPFDLDATRHTFTKTDQGGVEQVVVIDPTDTRNIDLIRSHLQFEATEFGKGNYSDPARIHGMDMPGLQELEAGASRVDVRYEEVPGGARMIYTSAEPPLVDALHSWFDRQSRDHGMPGMGG